MVRPLLGATLGQWSALAGGRMRPPKQTTFSYYLLGTPETRFAITRSRHNRHWRLPWQPPRGGWWLGYFIVWWSR